MRDHRRLMAVARVVAVLTLFLGVLSVPPDGRADVGVRRITDKPASTLLLPYFEVGLQRGPDTIFSYGVTGTNDLEVGGANSGPSAAVAHTTIWSDLGIPVMTYDTYLTGYDMQTVDLRQVLQGHLPRTGDAVVDTDDTISPQGQISQDLNFPGIDANPCGTGITDPSLDEVQHVQAALTGRESPLSHKCYCISRGDQIARGYITIDSVTTCTSQFPNDPDFFANKLDVRNLLWGNYRITGTNMSDEMVHIRASSSDAAVTTSGNYTFYGRSNAFTATDRRQPLATKFAAHFRNTPGRRGTRTTLFVWRDPRVFPDDAGFTCGTPPAFVPLDQEEIVVFDDQENPFDFTGTPFGIAAQKVTVDSSALPIVPTNGWLYLNLNHTTGTGPSSDPLAAQAWVTLAQRTAGRPPFNARAIPLDSANGATHTQAFP